MKRRWRQQKISMVPFAISPGHQDEAIHLSSWLCHGMRTISILLAFWEWIHRIHPSQMDRVSCFLVVTLRKLGNGKWTACDWGYHDVHVTSLWCAQDSGFVVVRYQPIAVRWRHNGCDSVSNHQPYYCLLNRLFRRWWKKTPKLRVTGLCAGNSPGTGEFPAQMASNAENVSISWRHHCTQIFHVYARPVSVIETLPKMGKYIKGIHKNWQAISMA